MQGSESDTQKIEVLLDNPSGNYQVEGFTAAYVAYVDDILGPDPSAAIMSYALKGIGGVICIVGFFTIFFGPSTVMVSHSGPDFLQMIQLYPGPIATVGSLIVAAGAWVKNAEQDEFMSPEEYLRQHYCFVGPDDCDPAMGVLVDHMDGEQFRIFRDKACEV